MNADTIENTSIQQRIQELAMAAFMAPTKRELDNWYIDMVKAMAHTPAGQCNLTMDTQQKIVTHGYAELRASIQTTNDICWEIHRFTLGQNLQWEDEYGNQWYISTHYPEYGDGFSAIVYVNDDPVLSTGIHS